MPEFKPKKPEFLGKQQFDIINTKKAQPIKLCFFTKYLVAFMLQSLPGMHLHPADLPIQQYWQFLF